MKNRHHLAAAAEALVKSGQEADGNASSTNLWICSSQQICRRSKVWWIVGWGRWRPGSKNQIGSTTLTAQNQVNYAKISRVTEDKAKIVDIWVTQQLVTSWKAGRLADHMTTTSTTISANLHTFLANLLNAFCFSYLILSEYDRTLVEATGVIYWFTLSLPLSYLAPISSKRQSSREPRMMLASSHLLLFVLLPFLPSSLQRSRF